MKIHKKLFSVLVVACLFLSVVGITGGGPAKAASGKTKVTLKEGKSATLKLKNSKKKIKRVTWKSKNKKIATVSKNCREYKDYGKGYLEEWEKVYQRLQD